MHIKDTVEIKIADSLLRIEPLNVYIAVNCTNDEALSFFSSISDMMPHIKVSIKCGVDVDKMSDHGFLVNKLEDIRLISDAIYFRSKDKAVCLDCVMSTLKQGDIDLVIGGIKIGSEL